MKSCDICGCDETETHCMIASDKWCMTLCGKHYQQLKRHGKIIDDTRQIRNRNESNEIRLYDDCAKIVLYNSKGIEVAETMIDLNDVEKCRNYKWFIDCGYVKMRVNKKNYYLHSFLMNNKFNETNFTIDHINRDKLNNRKNNLRLATMQQNAVNKSITTRNTSGCTGVYWYEKYNRWTSQIRFNNGRFHLGYFDNKEDAIKARREAELKYFGEFAPIHNN